MNVMQRKTGTAGDVLHVESVPIPEIVASVGSPVYVYSRAYFESRFRTLQAAVADCGTGGRVSYAVKANSNLQQCSDLAAYGDRATRRFCNTR